jgi:HK97 gp10 family phage protein
MREFNGLASFAAFAAGMVVEVDHAKHEALEKGAKIIEDEAKRVIGTYDYGWPPLAASTVARKGADTPLLETGEMRDSIEHTVGHDEARIGSNNDKALWHELGTSRIPPRPFLMGAAKAKEKEVADLLGHQVVKVLTKP